MDQGVGWAAVALAFVSLLGQVFDKWIGYKRDKRIGDLETEVAKCQQAHEAAKATRETVTAVQSLASSVAEIAQKTNGH